MHKKLKGDIARTAEPNWPKGYSRPHVIVLKNKTGGTGWGIQPAAQGLAGHKSPDGKQLRCASLGLYILLAFYEFPLSFCPVKLSLS